MDMNNTTMEKGPGYEVEESIEIMESYCVKIIGTTGKLQCFAIEITSQYISMYKQGKFDPT